jgi:hypothetical protein
MTSPKKEKADQAYKESGAKKKADQAYKESPAFYGTVECQGRGSLHLHLLIWRSGVPNPEEFLAGIKEATAHEK